MKMLVIATLLVAVGLMEDTTMLADAACSIAGNGETLSGPSGQILSDADGYKPGFRYTTNETCSWTIDCGANAFLQVSEFRGRMIYGNKLTLTHSGSESTSGVPQTLERKSTFQDAVLFRQMGLPVQLNWDSTYSIVFGVATDEGWSFVYQCVTHSCTSVNNSIQSGAGAGSVAVAPAMTITDSAGFLMSESDGQSYAQVAYYNDECQWKVQCPAGTLSIELTITGKLYSATQTSVLQVKSLDGSTTIVAPTNGVLSTQLFDTSSMLVQYIEDPISSKQIGQTQRRGFTLSWDCKLNRCPSPNATETRFLPTGSQTGTLVSDPDGTGGLYTTAKGAYCSWTVECPSGTNVIFYGIDNELLTPWKLEFYDESPAGIASNVPVDIEYTIYQGGFVSPSHIMRVVLNNYYGAANNGMQLNYKCSALKCFSPQAATPSYTSTVSSGSTQLLGTRPYFYKGETCQWDMQCSLGAGGGSTYMVINLVGELGHNDALTLTQGSSLLAFAQTTKHTTSGGGYKVGSSYILSGTDTTAVTFNFTTGYANSSLTMDRQAIPDPTLKPTFELDFACTSQKCTAQTAGQTLSTSIFGTIMTDKDGVDSTVMTGTDEACTWHIECPTTHSYLALSIAADVPSGSVLASDPSTGTTVASITNNAQLITKFIPMTTTHNKLDIQFTSTAANAGATISYVCTSSQCSSLNSTGSIFNATSGIIASDTDGAGTAGRYVATETCDWQVHCPTGTNFLIDSLLMAGSTDAFPTMNIHLVDLAPKHGGTLSLGNWSASASQVWVLASQVSIIFTTIDGGVADPRHGFTLRYQCLAPTCGSPNATGTTYTGLSSGLLVSDADGIGTTNYGSLQLCQWRITCATGLFALTELNTYLGAGDYLLVKDANTDQTIDTFALRLQHTTYFFKVSDVNVLFAADAVSSDRGFAANFGCVDPAFSICASPNQTKSTFTAAKGTLVSDKDGHYSNYRYQNGDDCHWKIQCPVGYRKIDILLTSSFDGLNGDKLTLEDSTTGDAFFTMTTNGYKMHSSYSRTSMNVSFIADSKISGPGFTLDYTCNDFASESTVCSSPTPTGSVVQGAGGSILSDGDGKGLTDFTTAGDCAFSLKCPLTTEFLSLTLSGEIQSMDHLKLTYGSKTVDFTGLTASSNAHSLLGADSAAVAFTPSKTHPTSSRTGWSLSYICSRSMCRSASMDDGTLTAPSGSVFSVDYTAGETCEWKIECAGASVSKIRFKISGSLVSGDTISIFAGKGTSLFTRDRLATTTSSTAIEFFVHYATATVTFHADPSNYGATGAHNYKLDYFCEIAQFTPGPQGSGASTCSSTTTVSGSETSGFVGFTAGQSFTSSEVCSWGINCPSATQALLLTLDSGDEAAELSVQSGNANSTVPKTYNGKFHTGLAVKSDKAFVSLATISGGTGVLGAYYLCSSTISQDTNVDIAASAKAGSTSTLTVDATTASLITCADSVNVVVTKLTGSTGSESSGIELASGSDSSVSQKYTGPTISVNPQFDAVSVLASLYGTSTGTVELSYYCSSTLQNMGAHNGGNARAEDDSTAIGLAVLIVLLLIVIIALGVYTYMSKRKEADIARRRLAAERAQGDQEMGNEPHDHGGHGRVWEDHVAQKNAALRVPGRMSSSGDRDIDDRSPLNSPRGSDSDEGPGPVPPQQPGSALSPESMAKCRVSITEPLSPKGGHSKKALPTGQSRLGSKSPLASPTYSPSGARSPSFGGASFLSGSSSFLANDMITLDVEDQPMCEKCTAEKATHACQPCGHVAFCDTCALGVATGTPCPLCANPASGPAVLLQFLPNQTGLRKSASFVSTSRVGSPLGQPRRSISRSSTAGAPREQSASSSAQADDLRSEDWSPLGGNASPATGNGPMSPPLQSQRSGLVSPVGSLELGSKEAFGSPRHENEVKCVECNQLPATWSVLPCGHVLLCSQCKPQHCPACNVPTSGFMPIQ